MKVCNALCRDDTVHGTYYYLASEADGFIDRLTAERDSLCASCVQEAKYNNAARGEIRKLTGESAVLRGLLNEALGVLETITDEHESDDFELLAALKGKIRAAIIPNVDAGGLI